VPLDVLVDARVVEKGHTGMARYVRELLRVLGTRPGLRLSAIQGGGAAPLEGVSEQVVARSPFLHPAELAELPLLVARWRGLGRRGAPFWVPSFNASPVSPGPVVLTVHDANHLAFPDAYGSQHALYYRTVVRAACARASAVLVPSSFARREVTSRIGVPASRVHVTLLGVNVPPKPTDEAIAKVRSERGLTSRYVLYVGNFKPHKNLSTLLDASVGLGDDVTLVLAGGAEEELGNSLPAARGAGARVSVLRHVPDEELWPLLAGASVFAFPSRYEGFGLPPLEAMAQGVPVVAADAASIPEVTGGAAMLVSPDDTLRLRAALREVLDDERLRQDLIARGRDRARELSWERCAERTAAVLEGTAR